MKKEWTCSKCKEKFPATIEYFPLLADNKNYYRNGHKKCVMCLNEVRLNKLHQEDMRHAAHVKRLCNFGTRIRQRAVDIQKKPL